MDDPKRRILDMLAEGKISADDAERLLRALERGESADMADGGGRSRGVGSNRELVVRTRPRFLRVVVDDADGGSRVNIKIPLLLLRSGIRLAALLPQDAGKAISKAFDERGIPFDPHHLKPDQIESFIESLTELELTIDSNGDKVRIFCE
ncbi:MAG: hypothetical protein JJU36_16590 [Phycisphaeraceae bacterium]|nr:hypothetical protein [Phycisphaeraceae bacterium]